MHKKDKEFKEYTEPVLGEYKGYPTIALSDHFSFGLSKAKLIVKFYEQIKRFVETEGKSITKE